VRGRHFSSDILITSTRANWFVAPLKPEVSSDGQLALTLPLDVFAESRIARCPVKGTPKKRLKSTLTTGKTSKLLPKCPIRDDQGEEYSSLPKPESVTLCLSSHVCKRPAHGLIEMPPKEIVSPSFCSCHIKGHRVTDGRMTPIAIDPPFAGGARLLDGDVVVTHGDWWT